MDSFQTGLSFSPVSLKAKLNKIISKVYQADNLNSCSTELKETLVFIDVGLKKKIHYTCFHFMDQWH